MWGENFTNLGWKFHKFGVKISQIWMFHSFWGCLFWHRLLTTIPWWYSCPEMGKSKVNSGVGSGVEPGFQLLLNFNSMAGGKFHFYFFQLPRSCWTPTFTFSNFQNQAKLQLLLFVTSFWIWKVNFYLLKLLSGPQKLQIYQHLQIVAYIMQLVAQFK